MASMAKAKTLGKNIIARVTGDDIVAYGYQLSFALLTASFPFIIFLFTLFGYTSLDPQSLLDAAALYFPEDIYKPISGVVLDVVGKQHGALLSASIILALWSASAGFRTLILGLDKALMIEERRPIWMQFIIALVGVIIFSFFVIVAMLALVFGEMILDAIISFFGIKGIAGYVRALITFIGPILVIFIMFILVYRFLPSSSIAWKKAVQTSIFATVAWTLFTLGFRIYVSFFIDYSRFYGVLGSIVGLIFWLLVTSLIILLSPVFTSEWNKLKNSKAVRAENPA